MDAQSIEIVVNITMTEMVIAVLMGLLTYDFINFCFEELKKLLMKSNPK